MESLRKRKLCLTAFLALVIGISGAARAQVGARVEDWRVPDRAAKAEDLTSPVTFVPVTPCRIVDTRGPAGTYGGPALAGNTQRDFELSLGPCTGIPFGVDAYSLNITVTQTQGLGDLRIWPEGDPVPVVSTLNYVPNQTVANAAIVPAGSNSGISVVAAVSGTHLIIDINGYFTDRPNPGNGWWFVVDTPGAAFEANNSRNGTAGCSGIVGRSFSTGARSFGVLGQASFAGENAGVYGLAGNLVIIPMPLYGQAAVRGEHAASFGVLGISRDFLGVGGSNVSAAGGEQTWGGLACNSVEAVCGMGTLSISGSKSFVEPHPTDAKKVIKFVSLEGNEAGTYFRGRAKFERGLARIRVPDEFRMVSEAEGLSIQITPIGEMASVAVVRIDLEEIVVKTSRNVEFFYLVHGVRKGYEDFTTIVEEPFFVPRSADYKMPESLSTEAKRKLVANGTYNADGTVNMETARRLGWTDRWKDRGDMPPTEQGGKK